MHAFVNDLERAIGTYLYGRRMYDVMAYWETAHTLPDQSAVEQDYARIWQAADKVVYSRTLDKVVSERTRIERDFDPAAIKALKESAGHDISVGGPELAAEALRAGLVDELHFFLNPVVVGGGGTRALSDQVHLQLDLLDEHRFGNGVVYVRYRRPPGLCGADGFGVAAGGGAQLGLRVGTGRLCLRHQAKQPTAERRVVRVRRHRDTGLRCPGHQLRREDKSRQARRYAVHR